MKKTISIRFGTVFLITLLLAIWRIIQTSYADQWSIHLTPLGGMALFAGALFAHRWKAYIFPILCLFMSDIFIMYFLFPAYSKGVLYQGWIWTYVSFILMVWVGRYITKINVKYVVIASIVAAFVHWLISDFGVWIGGGINITTGLPYTQDIQGLLNCYLLAIPFLKHMIISNLFYAGILFSLFRLLSLRFPQLGMVYLENQR